jgi:hypothetical protein
MLKGNKSGKIHFGFAISKGQALEIIPLEAKC